MDDQEVVCGRYPHAEAQEVPPILELGKAVPIECGYWAIYAGPDELVDPLGRGDRESTAWADAARRLKAAADEAA